MNPVPDCTSPLARSDAVNVAHAVDRCTVLGPGVRYVLWVQGCPLRCPGCINPDFLAFRVRRWVPVPELADAILSVRGIEGVTYVGGEPFSQAAALAALSRRLRAAGLSTMAYSGFALAQLRGGSVPLAADLLAELDLLMDGPYLRFQPATRLWRGSDNQRLIALSDRHQAQVADWNERTGQAFEIHLRSDGHIEVLGIPPPAWRGPQPRRTAAPLHTAEPPGGKTSDGTPRVLQLALSGRAFAQASLAADESTRRTDEFHGKERV